jgi:hypothetical protein
LRSPCHSDVPCISYEKQKLRGTGPPRRPRGAGHRGVCKPRPKGRRNSTAEIRLPILESFAYVKSCSLCTGRMVAVESTSFRPSEPPSGRPESDEASSPNSHKRVVLFWSTGLREATGVDRDPAKPSHRQAATGGRQGEQAPMPGPPPPADRVGRWPPGPCCAFEPWQIWRSWRLAVQEFRIGVKALVPAEPCGESFGPLTF